MKIYRRVIPKIAKDVVRTLLVSHAIEVEDGKRDEAEMDVAGALVRYLNDVDTVATDAREILARKGLPQSSLGQVKIALAEKRKVAMGANADGFVRKLIIDSLFDSAHVTEVFSDDEEIVDMISTAMSKYLGVDAELDREVRSRIRNLREGTVEWEDEYSRVITQMRASAGSVHNYA